MRIMNRSSCDSGQREGAREVLRVLRGDHEERLRQRRRGPVDGDLPFVHRFEQGRLRAWAGPVDLVGEEHVGEDRALAER